MVTEDNMINQKVLKRTLARIGLKDSTMMENGKLAIYYNTYYFGIDYNIILF